MRFARGAEPQAIKIAVSGDGDERLPRRRPVIHGDGNVALNGPIDDIQLRAWGIQLVDGRMPGLLRRSSAVRRATRSPSRSSASCRVAASSSSCPATSTAAASSISSLEEGIQLGYDTFTVPFGLDTISAVYALGFAARSALTFGGMDAGKAREIMLYNKYRVFAFVLALGEVDDLKYATAAGAISYGFPVIADTRIPQILPTGVTTYEHVVSMPFDEIPGADDMERAEKLIQRAIEVRGVKVKITKRADPGRLRLGLRGRARAQGDHVRRVRRQAHARLRVPAHQTGRRGRRRQGRRSIGPDIDTRREGRRACPWASSSTWPAARCRPTSSPSSSASSTTSPTAPRASSTTASATSPGSASATAPIEKGFRLEHVGKLLHARIHDVFGNIVDKVQVTLITEEAPMEELLDEARNAYKERNDRIANLTDESVDTFYSCLLCQSFAPNHVCVVNPERVGLCGAYNWLDCKASFEINPTGPNQPVPKGVILDPVQGEFSGPNEFIYQHSNQSVDRVTFYSIMEAPMTSCGCFECIMVLVPEANGFMIVSREDPSMTPCGMTFSTLAGTAGGGMQTPGMMGMGKYYLTSQKFISADGGLKRIVWMSSFLKESMGEALREVCEREGVPDLLERIADETVCTDVEGLLPFLEEKQHPALTMDPLF